MAYTKYQKLRLQGSNDGVNWTDITPAQYKKGDVIQENSSDCGGDGTDVKYKWVTVAGEYMCINNDKYTVIKKQKYDEETSTWVDTDPLETTYGELVESNSSYCGYGEYWVNTESWACSSVSGLWTTSIYVEGGTCWWSHGEKQGTTTGTYILDTTKALIEFSAIPTDTIRYPIKSIYVDGSLISSSVFSLWGNADHTVSMYFHSVSVWHIGALENIKYITQNRPPLAVENGQTIKIEASSYAGAWPFYYFSVSYTGENAGTYSKYYENPMELLVTSDCYLGVYYKNEAAKTGYTLIYNGVDTFAVDGKTTLDSNIWRTSNSSWFSTASLYSIGTTSAEPSDLRIISDYCFSFSQDLKYLQSVYFPTVEEVDTKAFFQLPNLTTVSLPKCEYIGTSAFTNCSNLSMISLPAASILYPRCFMGCTNLKKVYLLGSSVCRLSRTKSTSVIQSQFYGCTNLSQIIVPSSLYSEYKIEFSDYSRLIKSY